MLALIAAVILTWTAPGDDGNTGTAAVYDVRYATDSATVANWSNATQATGEPVPRVAGTTETFQLNLPNGVYWFAIRARDEVGNQSPMSNIAYKAQVDAVAPSAITDLR